MSELEQEPAKFYTGARKFPLVFGRFLDGTKVPGGPYTLTQIALGGSMLLLTLGSYSIGLWRTGSPFTDLIFGGGAIAGVFWGSGKIPPQKRNPISVLLSLLRAFTAPRSGKQAGRPLRLARPHSAGPAGRVISTHAAPITASPPEASAPPARAAEARPVATPTPATGLARLLAQTHQD